MAKRTTMVSPVYMGTVRQDFVLRNTGAVGLYQTNTIAFTNAAVAKTSFNLPANSNIIEIYVDVITAFNSSGTDLITIGKAGTANQFVTAMDVSTTGRKLGSANIGAGGFAGWKTIGTTDLPVTVTYTQSVADSSTGAANVSILYTAGTQTDLGVTPETTEWN